MSKWHPEELAQAIIDRIDVVTAEKQQAQAS
jgi:two-component system chemotaxis response regulator CheV